jgi:hypothetical protein
LKLKLGWICANRDNGFISLLPASTRKQQHSFTPLNAHSSMTASIKCQVFNYSLETSQGNHRYEALSYVWGDSKNTVPISIGRQPFHVTKNLHSALLSPRNHSMERILWVDAVCIGQTNNEEKESQI